MKGGKILFERCLHMYFIDEKQSNHEVFINPALSAE